MIPLFDLLIYPFFEKRGFSLRPISRMVTGMILCALAFLLSGLLQQAIDAQGSSNQPLSMLWQIPQYVIMTAGEIMFSITGLEFAYSQAPDSMKAVVQAAWLFTVSAGKAHTILALLIAIWPLRLSWSMSIFIFIFFQVSRYLYPHWLWWSSPLLPAQKSYNSHWWLGNAGNFVTVALVAIIGNSLSKANEFYVFAAGCFSAMLCLLWLGASFQYRSVNPPSTEPSLETLITHAADDRVYVG